MKFFIFFLILLGSSFSLSAVEDACIDVTCNDQGTCSVVNNQPVCNCNADYHAVGLSCVQDDLCEGITCENGKVCNSQTGVCEEVIDACTGVTCSNSGTCSVVDNQAICNCIVGYHAVGLSCIENDFIVGDIIITEIMANPDVASDDKAEWLEIYNSSNYSIDLSTLTIVRVKTDVYNYETIFLGNSTIGSHQYMLISRTTEAHLENVDATSNFTLGNNGETQLSLKLYGVILDSVIYKEENVVKGKSWQLDPNYLNSIANDNSSTWCLSTTTISDNNSDLGTPKLVNLSCGIDVCSGVTCGDNGSCVDSYGIATCSCDLGYYAEGLDCLESPSCDNVDCSNHGTCSVNNNELSCNCSLGYHPVGLECILDVTSCDNVNCSDHGDCQLEGSRATCVCDQDFHAVDLECISDDPCTDVDCSNHGVCDNSSGEAICNCDSGFKSDNLSCIEESFLIGDIIITEIMANPHINDPNNGGVPDKRAEWLELYNNSDNTIDLNGLKVLKGDVIYDVTFVADTTLATHQYLLIARTTDLSRLADVKATSNFEFVNEQSAISIKIRNTVLDNITYNYPLKGKSWQLDPQSFTVIQNDNLNNWCLGTVVISNENHDLGTPGLANISCRDLCANNSCENWQECNPSNGDCELKTGMCISNSDCTILATPICNLDTHLCIAEVIECTPACNDWEDCNIGNCELKDGRCNSTSDCGDNKICDDNNSCVDSINPCNGITCSDHGECKEVDNVANCECVDGYHADGLNCIEDTDLCENVVCDNWLECNSSNGKCELKDGMCRVEEDCIGDKTCDENHNCVDPINPCDGVTCNSHGVCENVDEIAICNCEAGYHADGLKCVESSDDYQGSSMFGCSYNQNSSTIPIFIIFFFIFSMIIRRKEKN